MAALLPEESAEPLITEESLLEMVPGDVGKQLTLIDFGRMRLITTKELTRCANGMGMRRGDL